MLIVVSSGAAQTPKRAPLEKAGQIWRHERGRDSELDPCLAWVRRRQKCGKERQIRRPFHSDVHCRDYRPSRPRLPRRTLTLPAPPAPPSRAPVRLPELSTVPPRLTIYSNRVGLEPSLPLTRLPNVAASSSRLLRPCGCLILTAFSFSRAPRQIKGCRRLRPSRITKTFPFSHLHRISVSQKHAHTRFLPQHPPLP
jgi:hypothetical protein